MTKEYAALSIRCGILAGAIDAYLGGSTFSAWGRFVRWNLTAEVLDQMKAKALELGAPAELFEEAERYAAKFLADEKALAQLRGLQSEFDKKAGVQ